MTRCPMRPSSTPSPTAVIRPTLSVPWILGNSSVDRPRRQVEIAAGSSSCPYAPSRTQTSVLFIPQALTSSCTSPGPGSGTGDVVAVLEAVEAAVPGEDDGVHRSRWPWGTSGVACVVDRSSTLLARVRPMDDKLRAALDDFQHAIREFESDGHIDDNERNQLRLLVERIDTILEGEDEHDGLTDHLEESAIKFEGRHPTIAATIRSVVDTLTGYGM